MDHSLAPAIQSDAKKMRHGIGPAQDMPERPFGRMCHTAAHRAPNGRKKGKRTQQLRAAGPAAAGRAGEHRENGSRGCRHDEHGEKGLDCIARAKHQAGEDSASRCPPPTAIHRKAFHEKPCRKAEKRRGDMLRRRAGGKIDDCVRGKRMQQSREHGDALRPRQFACQQQDGRASQPSPGNRHQLKQVKPFAKHQNKRLHEERIVHPCRKQHMPIVGNRHPPGSFLRP